MPALSIESCQCGILLRIHYQADSKKKTYECGQCCREIELTGTIIEMHVLSGKSDVATSRMGPRANVENKELACMICARKNALLKQYRDTVAGYIRIVKQMKKKPSALSQVDFDTLTAEAKDCLAKTKAAQRLLQQHVNRHHC